MSSAPAGDPAAEWYRTAFESSYLDLYSHRSDEAAAREVEWVVRTLRLTPGELMLDIGCGSGRHAAALTGCGLRVVGLDFSAALLRRARSRALPQALFLRADMRALPLRGPLAAVTSFFTSFGYFPDAADDEKVVAEMARVLRPGGRLLIDFLNAPRVRTTLVPESESKQGDVHVRQERWISPDGQRVEKRITRRDDEGGESVRFESVRLYERDDFRRLFEASGLRLESSWGDLAGGPYTGSADRLVLVATRS